MSRTIEQKVVEMRFDNSNFEKNVSTSMDSLNKLKDTIDKTSSGNSFAELGKAVNSLSFGGLGSSIQSVGEKFSALEQLAIGALRNIGANIEQHLVQALNKVTVDNIIGGFNKYGTITEATQTIMSAISGQDFGDTDKLEYVEGILEKLAWFSDETSYGLTDMTDNIAKFTSAGLDLETSTNAMMGIATWAANSGQNAQVAARAMYQLSQAMGQGTIQLMDWKSIEVANMGTKEVKELLLEYGALHGVLKKIGDGQYVKAGLDVDKLSTEELQKSVITYANFRNHLSEEKWLTAEVFADAMNEYGSYANALHSIIENEENDIDNASQLIGYLDKAMQKSNETGRSIEDIMMEDYKIDIMVDDGNGGLHSALEGVTELGIRAMKASQQARTWKQVVDSITDAASTQWMGIFKAVFGNVDEATELFTNLSEYFWTVFVGPIENLKNLFKEWKSLGGRSLLFEGDESALANLETALDKFIAAIKEGVARVFPPKTAEDLLDLTKRFRDFTASLVLTDGQAEKLSKTVSGVLNVFRTFGSIIKTVFTTAKNIFSQVKSVFKDTFTPNQLLPARAGFSSFFSELASAIKTVIGGIKLSSTSMERLRDIFTGIRSVINVLGEAFGWFADKIKAIGQNRLDKIVGGFFGGKFVETLLFIPSLFGKALTSIVNFVKTSDGFHKFSDAVFTAFTRIKEFIKGFFDAMLPAGTVVKIFDNVKTSISSMFESIKGSEKFKTAKENVKKFFDEVKKFFDDNVTYEKGIEIFNNIKDTMVNFGKKVATAFSDAKNAIKSFIDNSEGIKAIGEWFKKLFSPKDAIEETQNVETFGEKVAKVFDGVWKVIKWVADGVKFLWNGIKTIWQNLGVGDWLKATFAGVGDFFKNLLASMTGSLDGMSTAQFLAEKLKKIFSVLGRILGEAFEFIAKILPGVAVGAGGLAIGKGLSALASFFAQPFKKMFGGIKEFVSEISESIGAFTDSLKLEQLGEAVSKIIKSLAIFVIALAASVYILSSVKNPESLTGILLAFGGFIGELFTGFGILFKIMSSNDLKQSLGNAQIFKGISKLLIGMGAALLLISLAISTVMKAIEGQSPETIGLAIGSIALLLGEIAGVTMLLMSMNSGDKGSGKALNGIAITLIAMGLAVKILASVVKTLSEVDSDALIKGVGAVSVLIVLCGLFASVSDGAKGVLGAGVGLIAMALAIKILAGIAISLGEVSIENLAKGVVAVGLLIAFSAALIAVAGHQEGLLSAGIGMVLMSSAIAILANIAIKLGEIDTESLVKGTLALAAISAILAVLALVAGKSKTIIKSAVGLVAMSAAVAILGGVLLAIASFAKTDGGSGALWEGIAALAVALAALVAVGYLVGPVAVPLLAFAAAVALLGAGLLAFATAAAVFTATLTLLVTTTALTSTAIGAAITSVCLGIVNAGPAIVDALTAIIKSVLTALLNSKTVILETLLGFITDFLVMLEKYLPTILEALGKILDSVWSFLVERLTNFVEGLHEIILTVYDNVKEVIDLVVTDVHEGALTLIGNLDEDLNTLADNIYNFLMKIADMIFGGNSSGETYEGLIPRLLRGLRESVTDFTDTAVDIIDGFADGITTSVTTVIDAFSDLVTETLSHLSDFNENALWAVEDFISDLADSIQRHGRGIINGITRVCEAIMDIFFMVFFGDENTPGTVEYLGDHFIEGLVKGMEGKVKRDWNKIKKIAHDIFGIFKSDYEVNSPSKLMMRLGGYLMEGLEIGIEDGESQTAKTASQTANAVTNAMASAMSNIDSLLSDDSFQPTITPVMDLSQIQNGTYAMGNLLSSYDNYTMQAAVAASYNPYQYADGTLKVDAQAEMSDSIGRLEQKFDEMLYKLGKIRVVLDSGTLVGELVDPMDEALGRKAIYVGRGM